MNILLVDDEHLELEQLEYLLKPHFGFATFYKASDASRALQIVEKNPNIQLAFVDIQMPGKSGLELAAKLKTDFKMKIIMVTAHQSFEYAQKSIRIGVNNYLTKPLIESELIEVIQPFLNQAQLSDMVSQTIEIIHNRYHEHISLGDIAAQIHVNNAYLSRKFHEELGINFKIYVNKYRIGMAKRKLKDFPKMNIAEVSETCGFSSQHYFSSLFKKETGYTPSQFRVKETE